MATIHISEAAVLRDPAGLLAQVRNGTEVIIEAGATPIAVLKPATPLPGRSISEAIALAERHEKELGYGFTGILI